MIKGSIKKSITNLMFMHLLIGSKYIKQKLIELQRNKQIHNYSLRFQWAENQLGYSRLEHHHASQASKEHLPKETIFWVIK